MRLLIFVIVAGLLSAGCGGDGASVSTPDKPLPQPRPVAPEDVALENSNLVVDGKGRTYVMLPSDGDETDTDDEEARPGEGGKADTAPNVGQIARLTAQGRLDRSFGDDGTLTLDVEDGDYVSFSPQAIAAMGDEHLVVAGSLSPAPVDPDDFAARERAEELGQSLAVVRVGLDGEPDESFDGDGVSSLDLVDLPFKYPEDEQLEVVGLHPDSEGVTIAVRRTTLGEAGSTWLRLKDDGSPDRATWAEGSDDQFDPKLPLGYSTVGIARNAGGDLFYGFADGVGPMSPLGEPADYEDAMWAPVPYRAPEKRAIRVGNGLQGFAVLDGGDVVGIHQLYNDQDVKSVAFITRQSETGDPQKSFGMGGLKEADIEYAPDGKPSDLPGNEGITWFNQVPHVSIGHTVVIGTKGDIWVGGAGGKDAADVRVVKLDERGRITTSWGDDGVFDANLTIADKYMYRQPQVEGIVELEGGALLVLVSQQNGPFFGRAIYRVTPNGQLDGGWGKDGVATVRPTLPE